jgi:uncharacterized membrane protein
MRRDIVNVILGAALGHALYSNFWLLDSVDVIRYGVSLNPVGPSNILWGYLATGIVAIIAADRFARRQGIAAWEMQRAVTPLACLLPASLAGVGFHTPIVLALVAVLTVYRMARILPAAERSPMPVGKALTILAVATFGIVGYFTFLQYRALDTMYLNYSDWGIYYNVADNTLKGNWFYYNGLQRNMMGHHFMPTAMAVLVPFVWIFPQKIAFFALNAVVLHAPAIPLFYFAKSRGLCCRGALVVGLGYLIHPSLSQMTLSIFYGFHPIYMAIGLVILVCWLLEQDRNVAAGIAFVFALGLKETVAVFFAGLAIVLILRGRKRIGWSMLIASIAYFLLVTRLIIPLISGDTDYDFIYRYHHLGDSMATIAMSPFTDPTAFLGAVFRPHNFFFPLLLILPVVIPALMRPLWLLAAVPMLMSVGLQQNPDQSNIALQYHCEVLGLFWGVAVVGLCLLRDDTEPWVERALTRWLNPVAGSSRRALLASVAVGSLLAHYFFGIGYIGKNNTPYIIHAPRFFEAVEELKESVPPDIPITASPRLAAHLLDRNDVFLNIALKQAPPKAYVVLDLDDDITFRPASETFRSRLLRSGHYQCIHRMYPNGRTWLIYRRLYIPAPVIFAHPTEEEWEAHGIPATIDDERLSARAEFAALPGGYVRITVRYRVNKVFDHDTTHLVYCSVGPPGQPVNVYQHRHHFGGGERPAYLAQAGDVVSETFTVAASPDSAISLRISTAGKSPPDLTQEPYD